MMQTVVLADVPLQPWRNGGGVTQELLTWPPRSSADAGSVDWQCRVSVARIDRSGPFSAFPGVQRWFTVLSGEGVVLRFAKRRVMLGVGSEPLRFEGAAAPGCDLLDGPTQDLNLMLRSDCGHGSLVQAHVGQPWHNHAQLRAVFTLHACSLRVDGLPIQALVAGTLAYTTDAAAQAWSIEPAAGTPAPRAWWLHFNPHAA